MLLRGLYVVSRRSDRCQQRAGASRSNNPGEMNLAFIRPGKTWRNSHLRLG
ncbi:hypothetical protein PM082_013763 [Marasmius tenuissimus]|nr:hypothetical protein PM082_013763 [Marasmius tenuissimus]